MGRRYHFPGEKTINIDRQLEEKSAPSWGIPSGGERLVEMRDPKLIPYGDQPRCLFGVIVNEVSGTYDFMFAGTFQF